MDINKLHSRDVTSAPRLVLLPDGQRQRVAVAMRLPEPQLSRDWLPGSHGPDPACAEPSHGAQLAQPFSQQPSAALALISDAEVLSRS